MGCVVTMARMELRVTCVPDIHLPSVLDAARSVAASSGSDMMLLHSGGGAGKSILAFDPLVTLTVDHQGRPRVAGDAALCQILRDLPSHPLAAIDAAVQRVSFDSQEPLVGWLGFLSYDIGRFLEKIPARAQDDLQWPAARFTFFRRNIVFEAAAGRASGFLLGTSEDKPQRPINNLREEMEGWFRQDCPQRDAQAQPRDSHPGLIVDAVERGIFERKVQRVKEYIAAGDIYQANLAQRWQVRTSMPPFDVFERLCQFSPAPYAAFIRFDDGGILRHAASASPELFLQVAGRDAVTRPIKGTRPRDPADIARDAALREELLASAKDQAELTMIVDLLRNDLGRVSEYGSVRVLEPRAVEQHPTIWHTVATITARLRQDAGLAEILAALCPGGSITGAPKIRAMQIIEELEPTRRGLYCGNIGIIAPQAKSLALNIAIRTILFQNDHAYVHAGGGIVADSDPAHEYEETLHKATAMFHALGVALHI